LGTTGKGIRSIAELRAELRTQAFHPKEADLVTTQSRNYRRSIRDNRHSASSPAESPDRQQARLTAILTALQKSGSVSVEGLGREFKVSHVTVRRDLDTLEAQGLLRRTHGGAVSIEPFFYEPFRNDRSFQAQVEKFAEEKRRIGRAAAALINKGDIIALTPGTTTTEVIRGLPLNHDITVFTSTVNVAMELSKRKDLDVYVTGGHLHGDWFSLVGPTAAQSLSRVMIHVLFIGADGIDAKSGVSCYDPEEAQLNAVMVKHARKKVAVVDHSKFGVMAGWRICSTAELDVLVTDSSVTDEMVAPFEEAEIEVIRV
jgi:DeoR/GlpR family transcriptional regulator of sugar metabolism